MFDINSQEKQAHHQFMSIGPDQHKDISNHELFGNAAAYHAAASFTDHCEKNGVPENTAEAQKLVLGYANDFVNTQIDSKDLKLDKEEAMKYAAQCLGPQMTSASPASWRMGHTPPTGRKAFDTWTSTAKEFRMPTKPDGSPDYEMIDYAKKHGIVF